MIGIYTKEQKKRARLSNLIDLCERQGIGIQDEGNGNYRVLNYGGLIIKDNFYYWNATGETGSAIDFCVEILKMRFANAMEELLKCSEVNVDEQRVTRLRRVKAEQEKRFNSPNKASIGASVVYLTKHRKIPMKIVREVIDHKLLYQDEHANCVFPCYDKTGEARGAIIRGTNKDKIYKGKAEGSNGKYGWVIRPVKSSNKVIVFEAPIDAMSFLQLYPKVRSHYILALGGLDMETLETFLEENREVTDIWMALDNDEPARKAVAGFIETKDVNYTVHAFYPTDDFKDWNEQLVRQGALTFFPVPLACRKAGK
ncbi:DUF3991 and TOPRIM domain-containing protein [Paenibacillus typhae]|uniref:Toprim-like n=1 Tax=Paenibacillus typhae TaxID=1174501 RepID=A0A1G8MN97_9BACL|nr:DUF3991 and TOPRIM domain-containing protein [Paenibacillus typhae]SDI69394.1 Toprim-like [Paenibacillus typhae]